MECEVQKVWSGIIGFERHDEQCDRERTGHIRSLGRMP